MTPVNVLQEVHTTRRIGRIVTNIIEKLCGVFQYSYQIDENSAVRGLIASNLFKEFSQHVIKNLLEPFIKAVNNCDPSTFRYFGIVENSDNEESFSDDEDHMEAQTTFDITGDLRKQNYDMVIKRLCGKKNVSGDFDIVMSLINVLMY
jgi:hypothetical protein